MPNITNSSTILYTIQRLSERIQNLFASKGVPNGIATLDSKGKVPLSSLPSSIVVQVQTQTTGAAANFKTFIAGENISGGKAVVIGSDNRVHVYDITNESHYGKSCGIAKQAASTGETLDVYIFGVAYEAGSGWIAGTTYYISSTGGITSTPPGTGIIKIIGVGIDVDSILIKDDVEVITI